MVHKRQTKEIEKATLPGVRGSKDDKLNARPENFTPAVVRQMQLDAVYYILRT